MQLVKWEELQTAANEAFGIWDKEREISLAKASWSILNKAGLTRYDNSIERHKVLLRFISLPSIYRDWSAAAWEERSEDFYSDWAYNLELSPFVLGQLVGPHFESHADDDPGRVDDALSELVDGVRMEVITTITNGFGGDSGLFMSFWRIRFDKPRRMTYAAYEYEVLNDTTPDKLEGYAWIVNGCPRVR